MIRIIILLLLLFTGFIVPPEQARAHYLRQYTAADGLSSNHVYHVFRDSKGYLWFATDKGIARFDGKNFSNYTVLDGLTDNINFNLFEDREQYLWPFAYNGRYCRIRNGIVHQAGESGLLRSLPEIAYINAMCYGDDSTLYIGYTTGDIVSVADGKAALFYRHQAGEGRVTSLVYEDGLLKAYSDGRWLRFRNGQLVSRISKSANQTFYYNQALYVTDAEGLKVYTGDSLRFSLNDPSLRSDKVIHLYGEGSGNIFCSTPTGLHVLNTRTGRRDLLLPNQKVSCCLQDVTGDYWITTLGQGAWRLARDLDRIPQIGCMENSKIFFTDRKQLFIAAEQSLYVPEYTNGRAALSRLPLPFPGSREPLYYSPGLLVYYDLHTFQTCFYNLATHRTYRDKAYFKDLLPLGDHTYLGYNNYGLHLYHYTGDRLEKKWERHLAAQRIRGLDIPGEQKAYVLGDSTLYLLDPALPALQVFLHSPLLKDITGMYRYGHRLLFTSSSPGLIVADELHPSAPLQRIRTGNIIYAIAEAGNNTVLLSSLRGDYLFGTSATGYQVRKIGSPFVQDDYEGLYPFRGHYLVHQKSCLYFLDSALLNRDILRPVLLLNDISVNGRSHDTVRTIRIKGSPRCDISISAGTLYFQGSRNKIQYRVGDDDRWNTIEGNTVNLSLHRFGSYQVQLRAGDAIFSRPETISVILLPPFYRTTPFYIFVVLVIAAALLLVLNRIMARRRQAFVNELNYLKLEHRSVNALLNPHFVFNAIGNIQGLVNTGDREQASDYLAAMSVLIRQNMENLQFNLISADKELNLVRRYIDLQNMRFNHMIRLSIHTEVEPSDVFLPPLLIHTFVENAVVHGFRDKAVPFCIDIDIIADAGDHLLIRVTDNGVGLQQEKPGPVLKNKTSLGIGFNRKRLERINAFYKVHNSVSIIDRSAYGAQGTEVSVILYSKLRTLIQD